MRKQKVRMIENRTRRLMNLSPSQLKTRYGNVKLPIVYFHNLEDANWHGENNSLTKQGSFGRKEIHKYSTRTIYVPKNYSDSKEYEEYKKKGGRTYNLT